MQFEVRDLLHGFLRDLSNAYLLPRHDNLCLNLEILRIDHPTESMDAIYPCEPPPFKEINTRQTTSDVVAHSFHKLHGGFVPHFKPSVQTVVHFVSRGIEIDPTKSLLRRTT